MLDAIDAISLLHSVVEDHPHHKIVIGGDFNTELKNESPFDPLWTEFMAKHDLTLCDNFVNSQINYTYFHETLNQKKWNDHFLVSSSLVSSSSNHQILEDGGNPSDHHPIMMQLNACLEAMPPMPSNTKRPTLKWEKCSEEEKNAYTAILNFSLSQTTSVLSNCDRHHCQDSQCYASIQQENDSLICSIKNADQVLPRHKPGIAKNWWTQEVGDLKQKSIEITALWKQEGRPHTGTTNAERLRVRAAYKRSIKVARSTPNQQQWNKLHGKFLDKDTDGFWKSWKKLHNKNNSHLHPVVNGTSSKSEIAEAFKTQFMSHSKPNDEHRVKELNEDFILKYRETKNVHNHNCDCHSYHITLPIVVDSIFSMKKGKSCDDEGINAEHFFHAPFSLFQRVQHLLNAMLRHGFVPSQFKLGTIVPIVKDHQGNLGDTENYRGITMSPILSKILEHCLRILFSDFLTTSKFQFGFKQNSSTTHAVYCLREAINYYCERGSNTFCSFLDASKAFDRLVHAGLFLKLLSRKVPMVFIDIIIFWYDGLYCRVRWDDHYSEWFCIIAGVRQGGILSPVFYSIYVDELIHILSSLNVGCFICGIFVAALLYADDMALVSPSVKGLQRLLRACEAYCRDWDICLNPKKSRNMYFGKRCNNLCNLQLNGAEITWADKWKYLGVDLVSGTKFSCCISEKIRKFYRAANHIFRIEGKSDELIMLSLIETHCIPILTYAIEVIVVLDRDTRRQLRVAYNSVFRRIFSYRSWQSVSQLQSFLSRPTWEELLEKRTEKFCHGIRNNSFLNAIFPT